jgi:hypothetical protein
MTHDSIENQKSVGGEIENPAATGLPFFRTWPAVYAFVLSVFVLTVIVLILFSRAFS